MTTTTYRTPHCHGHTTQLTYEKIAPKKGRWPKSEKKRRERREQLEAATRYKRALEKRKYGTLGAASPVRRIDPKTGEVIG